MLLPSFPSSPSLRPSGLLLSCLILPFCMRRRGRKRRGWWTKEESEDGEDDTLKKFQRLHLLPYKASVSHAPVTMNFTASPSPTPPTATTTKHVFLSVIPPFPVQHASPVKNNELVHTPRCITAPKASSSAAAAASQHADYYIRHGGWQDSMHCGHSWTAFGAERPGEGSGVRRLSSTLATLVSLVSGGRVSFLCPCSAQSLLDSSRY